jgi:hypothetical protein
MLVGNKSDLEAKREVSTAMGEQFALENGMSFQVGVRRPASYRVVVCV